MSKVIYLDNASTTIPCREAIAPFENPDNYFNPSNLYTQSREIHNNLEYIRKEILKFIHAKNGNVYFTSGASEANNWLIKGIIKELKNKIINSDFVPHIITSAIEHDSILNALGSFSSNELDVTYITPDEKGYINPQDIENAIKSNTILVSIMYANNELGTIQPIYKIGKICNKYNIFFHTDATQIFGKQEINVSNNMIDFLTFSGHKFHGPKGIGGIYMNIKKSENFHVPNLIDGGGQEFGLRAGTENYPAILGMWNAIVYMQENYIKDGMGNNHINKINKCIQEELKKNFNKEDYKINSHDSKWIFNFSLKNINTDVFVICLANDDENEPIYISTGSACNTGELDPSHVLQAIKCPQEFINGPIRISYGMETTEEDIKTLFKRLKKLYYN